MKKHLVVKPFAVLLAAMFFLPTLVFSLGAKDVAHTGLGIPEPSDIAWSKADDAFYIVSDNGILFKTDKQGKVLQKTKKSGMPDFEGVCAHGGFVYVVDEAARRVLVYDAANLKLLHYHQLQYSGALNAGFESICYRDDCDEFLLFTEKSPLLLHVYDKNFVLKQVVKPAGLREVSAASWHDGKVWVLSDEERTLYRLNPQDYSIEAQCKLAVLNPEGLTFDGEGRVYILSDDMEQMHIFDKNQLFKSEALK